MLRTPPKPRARQWRTDSAQVPRRPWREAVVPPFGLLRRRFLATAAWRLRLGRAAFGGGAWPGPWPRASFALDGAALAAAFLSAAVFTSGLASAFLSVVGLGVGLSAWLWLSLGLRRRLLAVGEIALVLACPT